MVNFEFASSSSFQDLSKLLFYNVEVGDSSGCVNVICSQLEVADDVISGEDAQIFQECVSTNLCVASFTGLRENRNQTFM